MPPIPLYLEDKVRQNIQKIVPVGQEVLTKGVIQKADINSSREVNIRSAESVI